MGTRPRFPAHCPAFMLLDRNGFVNGGKRGEIVEGTFNDQGSGLILGFARAENWQDAHRWGYEFPIGYAQHVAGHRWRTPYFFAEPLLPDGRWQGAWHYTGRLLPLTRAAREMLKVVGWGHEPL